MSTGISAEAMEMDELFLKILFDWKVGLETMRGECRVVGVKWWMLMFVGVSILLERRECARCCCDAFLTLENELERGTPTGAVWTDMEELTETIDDERGITLLFGWPRKVQPGSGAGDCGT